MKKLAFRVFIVLLFILSLGLLYLTNIGVLSFDKPFIYQLSGELPAADKRTAIVNVNLVPMDSERVVTGQTIIIENGSIVETGFAVHEELALLVEAGLTPYEAIETGTRNAAEAMGKLDEFGTIEVGKRADLILLADNPLEDVAHIQNRLGVVVNGRFFSKPQTQTMLAKLVESYRPSLFDRVWPLGLIALTMFMILRLR